MNKDHQTFIKYVRMSSGRALHTGGSPPENVFSPKFVHSCDNDINHMIIKSLVAYNFIKSFIKRKKSNLVRGSFRLQERKKKKIPHRPRSVVQELIPFEALSAGEG